MRERHLRPPAEWAEPAVVIAAREVIHFDRHHQVLQSGESTTYDRTGIRPIILSPMSDSAKRWDHLRREQLQMGLSPSWRQSGRQRPRIIVCDRDVADKVPNDRYRGIGVDDVEKPALPQLFAIAQMVGKRTESGRRKPCGVVGCLIDDMGGGFSEGLLGIVGY